MKNNIMKTINNMYKSTPTLEESELLKLDSLLTRVGGDAKSILLKSEEYTMADFIDTCIRNGVTFELREDVVESSPPSETAPVSHNNPSTIQSPSEIEKTSEEGCEEAETPLTRITLDNWDELLSVGDEVISFGTKGNKDTRRITDLGDDGYDVWVFMSLEGDWIFFGTDNTCEKW
jgi:hypothetical protein